MTSNPEPMVQQLQHDFQNLLAYLTGPDAGSQTAYVELTLFRRLLALGAALLRLFFVTRAAVRPAQPVTAPDGTPLTYHAQPPTTDYSVFGKVHFARHSFTASGQKGHCPLDAALSLSARCYSDLLREWAAYGATDASYRESQTVLERLLGLYLSIQALETGVEAAGEDVTPFYEEPADPTASPSVGTILVVQADGKGVPMVQPPTQAPGLRLGKGQKRTKKKEAVVTGLYTITPYQRTPQEVVATLLQDPERPEPAARRQRTAGHPGGEGGGPEPAGAAGRPARWATHPAARGAERWGRGAATAIDDPRSGIHLDPGQHPCHGVSVGHGHCAAGEDPSTAHRVGPCVPGAAAGWPDQRCHHSVGGRGA